MPARVGGDIKCTRVFVSVDDIFESRANEMLEGLGPNKRKKRKRVSTGMKLLEMLMPEEDDESG